MMEEYLKNIKQYGRYYYEGTHSLPRECILHFLRISCENWYRWVLTHRATHGSDQYEPRMDLVDDLGRPLDPNPCKYPRQTNGPMGHTAALDFCNKTSPFYVLGVWSSPEGRRGRRGGNIADFQHTMLNWIFTRWFRPYRSEIAVGQFPVKLISVAGCDFGVFDDTRKTVNSIVKLHRRVCAEVEEQLPLMIDCPIWRAIPRESQDLFQLQPSFRAIVIVSDLYEYPCYEGHISQTQVLVVRTGDEEGLSAPIRLETIHDNANVQKYVGADGITREAVRTCLDVAYQFLYDLEQREIMAFGHRPDPKRGGGELMDGKPYGRTQDLEEDARRLGWQGEFDLRAPSSSWVDSNVFPAWAAGAQKDVRVWESRRTTIAKDRLREDFVVKHY